MDEKRIKCPDCGQTMDPLRRRNLVVNHCHSCGGHWFDRGTLTAWLGNIGSDPEYLLDMAPEATHRTCRHCNAGDQHSGTCHACGKPLALHCPNDGTELLIIEEQGMQIDVCLSCHGIWFDGDELATIVQRWIVKLGSDIAGRPCGVCGLLDTQGSEEGGVYRCRDCHHDHIHGDERSQSARKRYGDSWSSEAVSARTVPDPAHGDADGEDESTLAERIARFLI